MGSPRGRFWVRNYLTKLNIEKTKVIAFAKHSNKDNEYIKIDNIIIENVKEMKILGVIIDNKLGWKPHIRLIQNKVAKNTGIINKIKQFLDYNSLHILDCSLILPYFIYCIEIWGNYYKNSLYSLSVLQKRAVRVIHKAGYLDHTHSLFLQSKLLKLQDLVHYHTALIMFKVSKHLVPLNIQNLFSQRDGGYNLRGDTKFKMHLVRTTRKSFCVSVCGVKLCNRLEDEHRQCPHIHSFKSLYNNKVFERYKNEGL